MLARNDAKLIIDVYGYIWYLISNIFHCRSFLHEKTITNYFFRTYLGKNELDLQSLSHFSLYKILNKFTIKDHSFTLFLLYKNWQWWILFSWMTIFRIFCWNTEMKFIYTNLQITYTKIRRQNYYQGDKTKISIS